MSQPRRGHLVRLLVASLRVFGGRRTEGRRAEDVSDGHVLPIRARANAIDREGDFKGMKETIN